MARRGGVRAKPVVQQYPENNVSIAVQREPIMPSSGTTVPDEDLPITDAAVHSLDGTDGVSSAPNGTPSIISQNIQILGQGLKELVQAIARLEQLGVEKSDIPLPRIVAIGDQSAGKSSNIEGIRLVKCFLHILAHCITFLI